MMCSVTGQYRSAYRNRFLTTKPHPVPLFGGPRARRRRRRRPLQLPLASQSVDLVVLPHVLEFHAEPHEMLREADRVMMPEGQLVISGFNTASLWGLRQLFASRSDARRGTALHRPPAPADWLRCSASS